MYRLYNIENTVQQAIHAPTGWRLIKDGLNENLDKALDYYHRASQAVGSSHLLVRLITALGVPYTQDISRYYANVRESCLSTTKIIGLTSSINKGSLFRGVFYGPGSREAIIAHDDGFDPEMAHQNWRQLEPIQVIRHPRTDLGLVPPAGKNIGIEEGVAVILINVPMLAIQYRAWKLNEARNEAVHGIQPHAMPVFLHMYPLANMLRSHIDIAIFNRYRAFFYGSPIGVCQKDTPFFIMDYERRLNSYIETNLKMMASDQLSFIEVMRNIRLPSSDDIYERMMLPDVAPTRQVIWAFTLGSMDLLEFLFRFSESNHSSKNGAEITRVWRRYREYRNEGIIRSMLPPDLQLDFDFTIETMARAVDRRS